MQEKQQQRWLTPVDLENDYGIKQSTQAKYRMRKEIPFSKIGGKFIRYDRQKINKWLEEHEVCGHEY